MKCQKCQMRDAVIEMNVRLNQQSQRFHLCQECYQEVRQLMALTISQILMTCSNSLWVSHTRQALMAFNKRVSK